MAKAWTVKDIPPQESRIAVVTGVGGLGFETALALAGAGAVVVLAGRNPERGEEAVKRIRARHSGADIAFQGLNLASLASVAECAEQIAGRHDAVDLLINNAGVMAPPRRETTADGFELQLGTNYLGHFALTAHLLPLLRRARGPRVVNVSSNAHRGGQIHFDDLQSERGYEPWTVYSQSKLAMLMFALELQRRSDAAGWGLLSAAAHPGFARTELIAKGPGERSMMARIAGPLMHLIGQSAAEGALPLLYAATAAQVVGGGYYGPSGLFEIAGPPKPANISKQALDQRAAEQLWRTSEALTGVSFDAAGKV